MRTFCFLLSFVLLFSALCINVLAENEIPPDEFGDLFVRGDVDGNSKLEAKDYMKLKRAILGTYTLTADEQSRADVTLDGKVNSKDFMMLKRVILGTYSF